MEAALITIISDEGGAVILCLMKNVADFRKSPLSRTIQISQNFYKLLRSDIARFQGLPV